MPYLIKIINRLGNASYYGGPIKDEKYANQLAEALRRKKEYKTAKIVVEKR